MGLHFGQAKRSNGGGCNGKSVGEYGYNVIVRQKFREGGNALTPDA